MIQSFVKDNMQMHCTPIELPLLKYDNDKEDNEKDASKIRGKNKKKKNNVLDLIKRNNCLLIIIDITVPVFHSDNEPLTDESDKGLSADKSKKGLSADEKKIQYIEELYYLVGFAFACKKNVLLLKDIDGSGMGDFPVVLRDSVIVGYNQIATPQFAVLISEWMVKNKLKSDCKKAQELKFYGSYNMNNCTHSVTLKFEKYEDELPEEIICDIKIQKLDETYRIIEVLSREKREKRDVLPDKLPCTKYIGRGYYNNDPNNMLDYYWLDGYFIHFEDDKLTARVWDHNNKYLDFILYKKTDTPTKDIDGIQNNQNSSESILDQH